MSSVTAPFYVILEGTRARYGARQPNGLRPVESVRAVGYRIGLPGNLRVNQIAVRLSVKVPSEAFDPIMPSATVIVPEDLVLMGDAEVEVMEPEEPEDQDA